MFLHFCEKFLYKAANFGATGKKKKITAECLATRKYNKKTVYTAYCYAQTLLAGNKWLSYL